LLRANANLAMDDEEEEEVTFGDEIEEAD